MADSFDLLLRGAGLVAQAIAAGGVVFVVLVLRPADSAGSLGRHFRLIIAGAVGVALAQLLALGLQLTTLADERGWPLAAFLGTTYFRAALVRVLAAAALLIVGAAARRDPRQRAPWVALMATAVALAVTSAWTSHAAARVTDRALLLALDGLHQLAASTWVGGLVHLTAAAFRRDPAPWPPAVLRRFSTVSLVAVAVLVAAGTGLSLRYIDGVDGLLGTSYGVMVLTKGIVLAGLLALGALNFLAVRRPSPGPAVAVVRVRRFVEVELGLGLTVLFIAASLTSLPPAVDVVADRAPLAEVVARFTPRLPTLTSPALADMPVGDREAPRTAEDRAWAEYNHHYAGLFVLAMGALMAAQWTRWGRWARHWPLVFLGLAAFVFVRSDPGAWPLGPLGFWESLLYPATLQHRLFVLLVIAFGVFEWAVRTGRIRSPGYALVFPTLSAVAGGLLLAHSHAGSSVKAEFLIEVTHAPLGILAMLLGWSRWLELRLPAPDDRIPRRLCALALVAVGVLLILYRES